LSEPHAPSIAVNGNFARAYGRDVRLLKPQKSRMKFWRNLIRKNQNGGGANIEVVIYEAADRGIYREQILNDIRHLKFEGYIYEPKTGEIKSTF
jgi:hypothetical protein